jgi:hypothetical protein
MAFDVLTIVLVSGFVRDLFCVVDRIPAAPSDAMTVSWNVIALLLSLVTP